MMYDEISPKIHFLSYNV